MLVTDPENREADKQLLNERILSKFPGLSIHRLSMKHGLNALILGGAGLAIAKKAGLLAVFLVFIKKFGVIIIAGLTAIWGILRKKKKQPISFEQDQELEELEELKELKVDNIPRKHPQKKLSPSRSTRED